MGPAYGIWPTVCRREHCAPWPAALQRHIGWCLSSACTWRGFWSVTTTMWLQLCSVQLCKPLVVELMLCVGMPYTFCFRLVCTWRKFGQDNSTFLNEGGAYTIETYLFETLLQSVHRCASQPADVSTAWARLPKHLLSCGGFVRGLPDPCAGP